ncbi:MAG: nitroreductase family protein [Paracoccus sp. (in: a-proteobacteria)]
MPPDLHALMAARRSIRAYQPDPIDLATIERLCRSARNAPSSANLQPGRFHVLTGAVLNGLIAQLAQAQAEGAPPECEYSYFPDPMPPALKDRHPAISF